MEKYGISRVLWRFFRAALNFCMPVYFSCNLMKILPEIDRNLIIKLKVFSKTTGYINVFSFSNMYIKCRFWYGILHLLVLKKYGIVWNLMCP